MILETIPAVCQTIVKNRKKERKKMVFMVVTVAKETQIKPK
jgi:hypothetical protein